MVQPITWGGGRAGRARRTGNGTVRRRLRGTGHSLRDGRAVSRGLSGPGLARGQCGRGRGATATRPDGRTAFRADGFGMVGGGARPAGPRDRIASTRGHTPDRGRSRFVASADPAVPAGNRRGLGRRTVRTFPPRLPRQPARPAGSAGVSARARRCGRCGLRTADPRGQRLGDGGRTRRGPGARRPVPRRAAHRPRGRTRRSGHTRRNQALRLRGPPYRRRLPGLVVRHTGRSPRLFPGGGLLVVAPALAHSRPRDHRVAVVAGGSRIGYPANPGTVACSTASERALVRRAVISWYPGSRTICRNVSRLG